MLASMLRLLRAAYMRTAKLDGHFQKLQSGYSRSVPRLGVGPFGVCAFGDGVLKMGFMLLARFKIRAERLAAGQASGGWGFVQMLLVSTIMLICNSAQYARLCSLKSREICPIMPRKSRIF